MKQEDSKSKEWHSYLYFAFKKAKHFVQNETSFVSNIDIIKFEQNLDENVKELSELLEDEEGLSEYINKNKGYLYFVPKSLGDNNEARVRPKVTFPFSYQVIWAAVIIRIGEWFDTNKRLKNKFSMRDNLIRDEFDWMVPWSFNGRLKRLQTKEDTGEVVSTYIQYNDRKLYEGHQLALRKYHTYEKKVIDHLYTKDDKVYKANLDIEEFFPTLKKEKIIEMFNNRFIKLSNIDCFKEKYFDPLKMQTIVEMLFKLEIIYPDTVDKEDDFYPILTAYLEKLVKNDVGKNKVEVSNNEVSNKNINVLSRITDKLNKSLPLDLIASNFLANCTLNYYVDRKLKDHPNVFVLRYTDDYSVISNEKGKIIQTVIRIKELLNHMNLDFSPQKTLPTSLDEIKECLKLIKEQSNWSNKYYNVLCSSLDINENKLYPDIQSEDGIEKLKSLQQEMDIFGIEIIPKIVRQEEFSEELLISRLSTSSEVQVKALTSDEIELYIKELMTYLKAKGDVGELKEETAKIFASWRLNSTYRELVYRKNYQLTHLRTFLKMIEEFIVIYPHKQGYIDIYLLLLLQTIEHNDEGYDELRTFLNDLPKVLNFENDKSKAIYFSATRIKILKLMTNNWRRFNLNKKKQLRTILENAFIDWYAKPKVYWEELYVMYESFFVLRIKLPLEICKDSIEKPEMLADLSWVYKYYLFNRQKEIEIEKHSEKEENSEKSIEFIDDMQLSLAVHLFKQGLYWCKNERVLVLSESDYILYHLLMENIDSSTNLFDKITLARTSPDRLNTEDWDVLTKNDENQPKEAKYELYEFMQTIIKSYFERPSKYSSIIIWIDESNCENEFLQYTQERFDNYQRIRKYYSLTDSKYPFLKIKKNEEMSQTQLNNKNNKESEDGIPVADWVFYCQMLPYHLDTNESKQKVLHPLIEYEYILILKKIVEKEPSKDNTNDNNVVNKNALFYTKLSFYEWEEIRKVNLPLEFNPLNVKDVKSTRNYAKYLFKLLTNSPWNKHVRKKISMYKWNDLDSYFRMTYFPSSSVANLFVNNLNIHQYFYAKLYYIPIEELPYRNTSIDFATNNIIAWINSYLNNKKDNYVIKNDNRKLEILEVNIDQLGD